ncbi:hypothetical protein UA08_05731 [Talaromyces atroroseus]|uniref:DUF7598 domain-containing protein n=1 Tax=Talaromyces atroroseus TaxID=1441469 RepID=A0A225AF95_TALAT|nr:hypothetical protein UA08_05731 [Talaromyces atroroseus]OKL59250.1 hypothetical protein UA08_05731 [Talaromyces atroroseus]
MANFFKALAGPGYVILNVIRGINIIVFLDTIAAGVVMLIKISMNNNFFFFEAVSHAITVIISIFLIVTELPVFEDFFIRFAPQLSKSATFVPLALIMIVMGVSLLGNLNNNDYSVDNMGLPSWRVVASAGIMAMTMGILNFMASFVFADTERSLTARHVRSHGAVADKVVDSNSSQRSFKLNTGQDGLPTYRQASVTRSAEQRSVPRFPLKVTISSSSEKTATATDPVSSSDVTRPDLAHHPAMQAANFV